MTATTLLPGLNVSRETFERLQALAELVLKWTQRINLISAASAPDIWTRHIVDSAQLFGLEPEFQHWADLGSGAGFPGIVIATLAAEHLPQAKITLVESDQRKATFLRSANRELGLSALILTDRIEALAPLGADMLSARALGPLDALLGHAARHLTSDGIALFPKGRTVDAEIATARTNWGFELDRCPSITDPEAAILRIKGISRV